MSRAAVADAHAWALPALKELGKGERTWRFLRGLLRFHASGFEGTRARLQFEDVRGRLVVAADKRSAKPGSAQEMQYGCGAAALLLGEGDHLLARFLGSESVSVPFVDHFRQSGVKNDYGWEERWVRDEGVAKIVPAAIATLLKSIGRTSTDVSHFAIAGAPIGSDKLVAKALKIDSERVLPDFQGQVGDTGAAQSLLQLIVALERGKPGDVVIIAAFSAGCECFGHPIGASGLRMVYEHYLQLQGRAGPRQLKDPQLGLSHNLGGVPYNGICAISIVGREGL